MDPITATDPAVELYRRTVAELTPAAARNPVVELIGSGAAPIDVLRRIAGEEYRIVRSDRRAFAALAARFGGREPAAGLFLGLAAGEGQALGLLEGFAGAVGMDGAALRAYEPRPAAQSYPHHLAWLAQFGTRSAVALALLANFGFWGGYCARVAAALPRHYGLTEAEAAFFAFFAELPPGFERAALSVLREGLDAGEDPVEARRAAVLMQAYESAFWAAVA
ncbi:transcriptional regulator [Kitasatospora sp. NPDC048540]|uniref:transcriptional regulator n=1 Tax=Kitasatospora sp. NPDC048540 TaxID=3155634 RepID=UPI00340416E5